MNEIPPIPKARQVFLVFLSLFNISICVSWCPFWKIVDNKYESCFTSVLPLGSLRAHNIFVDSSAMFCVGLFSECE